MDRPAKVINLQSWKSRSGAMQHRQSSESTEVDRMRLRAVQLAALLAMERRRRADAWRFYAQAREAQRRNFERFMSRFGQPRPY